jgi:hypothetical protein
MKEYKMFVFGETLEKSIEALPEEHQLKYYRIIKDYGLHGIEPELTGFELGMWLQMKSLIDNTMPKKHRVQTGKRGAPYGNDNAKKPDVKGGASNNADTEQKTNETNETNEDNAKQINDCSELKTNEDKCPNIYVNDNIYVNENDNVNVNVNINERYESLRLFWNNLFPDNTNSFLILNVPAENIKKLYCGLNTFTDTEIKTSFQNYGQVLNHPETYNTPERRFRLNFFSFLEKGVDRYKHLDNHLKDKPDKDSDFWERKATL